MYKKVFDSNEIDESNYNFVVSNLILSQTEKFTYNDIIIKLKNMFKEITAKIESVVKSCLIRLRENGFLSALGSTYLVANINV